VGQLSAHPGYGWIIFSDPRGWALNRTVGPIDVLLFLAFIEWALIWAAVLGARRGGVDFIRA